MTEGATMTESRKSHDEAVHRLDLVTIATMDPAELCRVFDRGEPVSPNEVAGWEFRGYNVPQFASVLGIRKFVKGFKSVDGEVRGYNIKVAQNGGPLEPWIPLRNPDGTDIRHGYYLVEPAPDSAPVPRSLFLDYGRGGNPRLDPSSVLRDYLRKVEPGRDDLLIGRAYAEVLGRLIYVSEFILERWRRGPY